MSATRYEPRMVFTARNPTEAYFVRGLLESAGIFSEIRNEALFVARGEVPMTPDTLPQIWVLEPDAERALAVLANYHTDAGPSQVDAPWTCPGCAESLEGQFTSCWNCGADRPAPGSQDAGDSTSPER